MKKYISARDFWVRQIFGIFILLGGVIFPFFGEYALYLACFFVLCTLVVMGFFLSRSNLAFDLLIHEVQQRNIQSFVKGSSYIPFFGIRWYFCSSDILRTVEEHNRKTEFQRAFESLRKKFLNPNPYKLQEVLFYTRQILDLGFADVQEVFTLIFLAEDLCRGRVFDALRKVSEKQTVRIEWFSSIGPSPHAPEDEIPDSLGCLKLDPGSVKAREEVMVFQYFNRVGKLLANKWDGSKEMLESALYDAQVPETEST